MCMQAYDLFNQLFGLVLGDSSTIFSRPLIIAVKVYQE